MIRSLIRTASNETRQGLSETELVQHLKNTDDLVWVDVQSPTPAEIDFLTHVFNFHPLAIEDCLTTNFQAAKIDDYGSYLFLVLNAIAHQATLDKLYTVELDIFLGQNFVVTLYIAEKMTCVDRVWERLKRDERLTSNGSDFLCHAILDHMIDEYLPLIDQLDEEFETIEDIVLEKPNPEVLQKMLDFKHTVTILRRVIIPQREVINRLSRDDYSMIDRQSRLYFRDIYDHILRIQDFSENIRDVMSSAMDIYLSSISVRQNDIMKALTIVSTIFLPLSFIASVYGMNFAWMPFLNHPAGFWIIFSILVILAVSMLYLFRRRNWF